MALWSSNQISDSTLQQSVLCQLSFCNWSWNPQTPLNASKLGFKITLIFFKTFKLDFCTNGWSRFPELLQATHRMNTFCLRKFSPGCQCLHLAFFLNPWLGRPWCCSVLCWSVMNCTVDYENIQIGYLESFQMPVSLDFHKVTNINLAGCRAICVQHITRQTCDIQFRHLMTCWLEKFILCTYCSSLKKYFELIQGEPISSN